MTPISLINFVNLADIDLVDFVEKAIWFGGFMIVVLIYSAFLVVQINFAFKLFQLRKKIKYFMAHSKQEYFEAIKDAYQDLPKKIAVVALLSFPALFIIDMALSSVGLFSFLNIYNFRMWAIFLLMVITVVVGVFGIKVFLAGNKATALYRNLYPPVPTEQAFRQMNAAGYILHSDEELYETMDDGTSSEDANTEIFGEKDPEIMQYVEGGKSFFRQETEVPISGEEMKLAACPLCGSLNSKTAVICDFCGAALPPVNEEADIDLLEEK